MSQPAHNKWLWIPILLPLLLGAGHCLAENGSRSNFERSLDAMTGAVDEDLREGVLNLYEALAYQLIWDDTELLDQLQTGIASSFEDGLNPGDYALPGPMPGQVDEDIGRDIGSTVALITLLNHLYYGKVSPTSMNPDWNIEDLRRLDQDRGLIVEAINNRDLTGLFRKARPEQDIYEDLKSSLTRYRQIQAKGGWPTTDLDTLLKPGQHHAAVPDLRRRLAVTGDYDPASEPVDAPLYDPELQAAVRHFQRRHLLAADSIIGPDTLTALNRPVGQKIDQIRANLERMRWFLKGLGNDFLLVDIAGYELYLVQDDTFAWSSAIQVGKPFRQTPVLKSHITYLEWNPTWTVPPTILNEDVLPAIQRDIGYLQRNNMDVLSYQGEPIDPETIPWQDYTGGAFPYLIRQRPGPWNALGTVKFIFPNEHLVYLHDTPSKNLFKQSSRAFSSGCIRVARPYELAKLLLDTPGAEGSHRIQDILDSGQTRRQYLKPGFPVVLLYWTTKLPDDGTLVFAPDIYDRDSRIVNALDS